MKNNFHYRARFQPTLPARGATILVNEIVERFPISTHAPRTGSDIGVTTTQQMLQAISTHAPRTGSDQLGAQNQDH